MQQVYFLTDYYFLKVATNTLFPWVLNKRFPTYEQNLFLTNLQLPLLCWRQLTYRFLKIEYTNLFRLLLFLGDKQLYNP